MKMIWIVGLLALVGCAGNKPMVVQTEVTKSDKCKKIENYDAEVLNALKMPGSVSWDGKMSCPCHETIACNEIEYCISFECSDGEIIPSF
jgi:hypothetical protein